MSQPLEGEGQAHKTHTTAVPLVPTFSVLSQSDYVIQGQVNGVSINILVDTGAATTVLSARAWEKIGLSTRLTPTPKKLVGVQGNPLQLLRATRISIMLQEQEFTTDFTVADALTTDLILGRDFLKAQQCTIQMGKNQDVLLLQQFGMAIPLTHKKVEPEEAHVDVILPDAVQVPPHSEMEVVGKVPSVTISKAWIMESSDRFQRLPVKVARAVVQPKGEDVVM